MRAFALLLLVIGWGVPLAFPHLAADDLLCAVAAGEGEASRLEASGGTGPADHCAVCHSLRSFRHAGLPDGVSSIVLISARALSPAIGPRLAGATRHRLPARAPPA